MTNKSDDELLEHLAVFETLSAEDENEDGDHEIVDLVSRSNDDGVGEEENDSDVFEAVGGEEEGISVPFNNVTDLDGGLVLIALVKHHFSLLDESEDFNFEGDVLVLSRMISYVLVLFDFGVNLGLEESENVAGALVLHVNDFLSVQGEEADQEGGEDDGFHK